MTHINYPKVLTATAIAVLFQLISISSFAQCTVNAGADITICSGQSITIGGVPTATGGSGTYTYDWTNLSGSDDVANPTISPTLTTTYTVTVDDGAGCVSSDAITVTVTALPVANAGPDIDPCLNSAAITMAAGGTWTGAAGSLLNGNIFTPSAVGTYNLTYTVTANGCSNSDQRVVLVRPKPTVNAGADQSICIGSCAQLSAAASSTNGAITLYTWSGGTVNNSMSSSPTACPSNSTTYNVTVVDAEQCNAQDQVTVTVVALPTVDAGADLTLCNNPTPTTLTGQNPTGGVWSGTGVTSAGVFTPAGVNTYVLTYTYTTSLGCVNSDTRTITVIDAASINAGPDRTACVGASNFQLNPVTPGGTWSGSTYVTSTGIFTPSMLGSYTLTYSVNMGTCTSMDQVVVNVFGLPTVSAGLDKNICVGASTTLNGTATGGLSPYTILWNNASSLSNASSLTPTASPSATTTYTLTVVDNRGCSASDVVDVNVNTLPVVAAGADMTLCNTPNSTALAGYSPIGGTWSGTGVTAGGVFTPNGVGTYTLTYTYTNASACTASDALVITVVDATSINAGPDRTACVGSSSMVLNPVTPGGTWSGSALVTAGGIFTPTTVGTYTLTYSINMGVCNSVDQITVQVFGLPTANAGADQSLCNGSSVSLSGTASNGQLPYTASWNNPSTLNNATSFTPTASITATTQYTLTVTDNNSCTATDNVTININTVPAVNAGLDQTVCDQASPFMLTGQSPAGGTWSGSCVSSNGQYSPCGAGTYTLTYCYTSAQGCSACDTKTVTVTQSPSVNAGPDMSICSNEGMQTLSLTASSAGTWTGAGIVDANLGVFDPIMSGPGYHTVTLTVGSGVCQVADSRVIQVKSSPNVTAGADQSTCYMSAPIPLNGGFPTGGHWEGPGVDDDDDAFDPSVGVGTQIVSYRYQDNLTTCADTAYKNIVVASLPTASFSIAPVACEQTNVVPNNTSLNAAQYLWNFGEGNDVSGIAPSHMYTGSDEHEIRLIAISSANCRDTIFQTIEIMSAPQATMSADVSSGCAPLEVQFNASVTGEDVDFAWDFGNSVTSTDATPSVQTFLENGGLTNYLVFLNVSNMCGTDMEIFEVEVLPRPTAAFNTNVLSTVCSPVTVSFDNNSSGLPDLSEWHFGDGGSQMIDTPDEVVYYANNNAVTYDIELVVMNECGADSLTQSLTVQPNIVHAAMTANSTYGCSPFNLNVENAGTGGTMIQYEFNPAGVAIGEDASYTYADAGFYTIYQYATDGCGFDTTSMVIEVLPSPELSFVPSETVTCEYNTVEFEATSNDPNTQLNWTFGDGNVAQNSLVQNIYPVAGTYAVTLTGTAENMCTTSVSEDIVVHPRPNAEFSNVDLGGCTPYSMCPENLSTGATQYFWDFGDGNTFTTEEPCFTFPNFGTEVVQRNVVLLVNNQFNCSHTYQQQFEILPQPEADYTFESLTACDYPVVVTPTSVVTDYVTGYTWMVDGATVSNDQYADIAFNEEGTFDLALQTVNAHGCTKTNTVEFGVFPAVVAAFTNSFPNGCLNHTVEFTSLAENATQTYWQFGDGEVSLELNPNHTFTDQGVFDVTLIASAGNGCADTLTMFNMVETYPLPVAEFKPSMEEVSILYPEVEFENQSIDGVTYTWNFGTNEVVTDENPTYEYAAPGVWPVTLTAYTIFGCKDSKTEYIKVTNDFQVYIPNSFTPNNDGLNDVFKPEMEGLEFVTRYNFQIFNRWGEVVFETEDPEMGWVGNPMGEDYYAESEGYSYQLIIGVVQSAEVKVYRGLLTMIK